MTHPHTLDAETVDIDLDGPTMPLPTAPAGVLDAEDGVGEWDTPAPRTARAATSAPGRPGKAEVTAEYQDRAERRRGARRRRRFGGVAMVTLILASAAASVFGWPVVLAGVAVAGGTGAVGVAAVKGTKNANGGNGRRRGIRGGGAGYSTGGNRRRLFGGGRGGGGGGLFGGRGRGGGGGGGRRGGGLGLGGLLGGKGKKAGAGAAGGPGRKPGAGKPTAGARSGPAGRKPGAGGGSHRAPKGPGLLKKLTGGGRHRAGGNRANSRFGANNRRRQQQTTPNRRQTRAGAQQQPRTFRGQARQARKQAVRQARQQLAQQVGQHRAQRRMRRRNGRIQRRIAASQQRQQRRQANIVRRQSARRAWRARVNQRRLQRAAPYRAWWRRRFVLAAARARRRGRAWIVQPVRRRTRQLGRWAAGRARAGYRRVSPMYALARRAQLLARLRRLNPAFGQRPPQRRRWRGARYYTRRVWDASLGRLFVSIRRMLIAAAHNRRLNLAQLWRDFYAFLAQHIPHRHPRAVPVPPRAAGPTLPFRGMTPAQRAAVAATLGMGAGATAASPRRPPPRRPARPVTPATARAARPSTRTPRPAMAVPTRSAVRTPRGTRPMVATAQADAQEVTHPTWEAALAALNDSVANYQIPDDGTGVLDVDAFISSIGGFMNGFAGVLDQVGAYLGEGPTNQVVVEQLAEFATAITAMGGDAAQVYEAWRTNEDNAHDLRRAEGEINRAELFNVGG